MKTQCFVQIFQIRKQVPTFLSYSGITLQNANAVEIAFRCHLLCSVENIPELLTQFPEGLSEDFQGQHTPSAAYKHKLKENILQYRGRLCRLLS